MKSPSQPLCPPRGVTLLELIVAITVLAVLAGIGVPAFSNIMRSNEIAAGSNNLLSALILARSEAMKRGVRVSVCPSNATANGCTEDWSNGLLVFSDDFGAPGVLENPANDVPLQLFPAPANGVTVTSAATSVVFMPSAATNSGATLTFSVTKTGCTGDQRRQISVTSAGRVSLTSASCVEEDSEEDG